MAQDITIKKGLLLRVDSILWGEFLKTIPRSEYTSINEALNEMIQERVANTSGDVHERKDPL